MYLRTSSPSIDRSARFNSRAAGDHPHSSCPPGVISSLWLATMLGLKCVSCRQTCAWINNHCISNGKSYVPCRLTASFTCASATCEETEVCQDLRSGSMNARMPLSLILAIAFQFSRCIHTRDENKGDGTACENTSPDATAATPSLLSTSSTSSNSSASSTPSVVFMSSMAQDKPFVKSYCAGRVMCRGVSGVASCPYGSCCAMPWSIHDLCVECWLGCYADLCSLDVIPNQSQVPSPSPGVVHTSAAPRHIFCGKSDSGASTQTPSCGECCTRFGSDSTQQSSKRACTPVFPPTQVERFVYRLTDGKRRGVGSLLRDIQWHQTETTHPPVPGDNNSVPNSTDELSQARTLGQDRQSTAVWGVDTVVVTTKSEKKNLPETHVVQRRLNLEIPQCVVKNSSQSPPAVPLALGIDTNLVVYPRKCNHRD